MRYFTVVDEAHTSAAEKLQEMCSLLDEGITEYIKILNQVTEIAAMEGRTKERYQAYVSMISGLKGQLGRIGNVLNYTANSFPSEINDADSYLY